MRRVVLITGASTGLGYATARYLSEKGYKVYGTSRSARNGETRDNFTLLQMDLLDPDSVTRAIHYIAEMEGKLDVVVNNAGIGINGPLECLSDEEIRQVFQTNVFGLMRVCRESIPLLRLSESGIIINISSIAGEIGLPYRGIYSASKFAVEGYSESLSMELKPFGIRVVIVQPGDFATNINANRMVVKALNEELYPDFRKMDERVNAEVSNAHDPSEMGVQIYQLIEDPRPPMRKRVAPLLQRLSTTLRRILPGRLFEKILMKFYKV